MRVVVERRAEQDTADRWVYEWRSEPWEGLLLVDPATGAIEAAERTGSWITAVLVLQQERERTGRWPERVVYAPTFSPAVMRLPRRESVQRHRRSDDGPGLRPRTLGQRAAQAKRGT